MADSDYRDDRDRDRDRDDRYDDRPRRRRDDDRPRKKGKGLLIVLVLLGVVGLVCVGSCGAFIWWGVSLAQGAQKAGEEVLAKVGGGDMTGAYNAMSSSYKATHTQEQFTKAMTDARLTEYAGVTWTNSQSNNDVITLSGTANLKSGGTAPVSIQLRMLPDMKTFEVNDISGGTGGGGPTTSPTTK